tara:strand:+ start:103 stop:720 length:618 start_codon:yes stop_codon:yes gene_type:complete
MKNIVIFYMGGSGGFFIYYYLLASDSNIFSKINMAISIGQNKNFLDVCFYQQFQKHTRLNNWKKSEIWPTFKKVDSDSRQIFLCCGEIPKDFDASDSVIINPYIADKKKWLRMQANKRCFDFIDVPKNISRKDFFIHYKKIYRRSTENSKVKDADYFFDFFKFLRDKSEREKLCDFLKIDINPRMEDYLTHYIDCHGTLFDKLIK